MTFIDFNDPFARSAYRWTRARVSLNGGGLNRSEKATLECVQIKSFNAMLKIIVSNEPSHTLSFLLSPGVYDVWDEIFDRDFLPQVSK